jgi:photosystem II stability/assembly factor-like uncharacterized protein
VSVAADDGVVLIGDALGGLRRRDHGVWTDLAGSPPGALHLAMGHGAWLATTATEAVWVSEDQGTNWMLADEGLDPLADGLTGDPGDGVHYADLVVTDDAWLLAGWEGTYTRPFGDVRWHQAALRTIPLVESLVWMPDGTLLVGVYGGGVYRGTPGGQDWRDVSIGVGWPWVRHVVATEGGDGEAGDDWYVGGGNALYRSSDGGATWTDLPVDVRVGGDAIAASPDYANTKRAYFGGEDDDGHPVVTTSHDGGASWASARLPGSCAHKPSAIAEAEGQAWAGCEDQLYRSADGGATWTRVGAMPGIIAAMAVAGDLYVATGAGVVEITAQGPGATLLDGLSVSDLAFGPDSALWAVVDGWGVARVDPDGTESWAGWPVLDIGQTVAVSDEGRIAVGTYDGVYTSDDDGNTWTLACPFDRYDDADQAFWWDGWEVADADGAKADAMHNGGPGAVAEWDVSGEQLALIGTSSGARLRVTVDGEQSTVATDTDGALGDLWRADVPDGDHLVRVEVLEGTVRIDGGERWRRDAPPLPVMAADGPTARDCGCGSGHAGMLVLVPVLFRRRRRSSSGRRAGEGLGRWVG